MSARLSQRYATPRTCHLSAQKHSWYLQHALPQANPLVVRWQSTSVKRRPTESVLSSASAHNASGSSPALRRTNFPDSSYLQEPQFPKVSLSRQAVPHSIDDTVDLRTTRPAPIETPPDLVTSDYPAGTIPLTNRAKHLFKTGKAYLAFYKTGFKNVWLNYKQYRKIRQKIAPHTLNEVAKYGGQVRDGVQLPAITRAEYQLCLRTRHDLLKLIPFSIVFIICGEFTPLAVLALGTRVVPYTCRIWRQEEADIDKAMNRDRQYYDNLIQNGFKDVTSSAVSDISQNTVPQDSLPPWHQEWVEAYRYNLTSFSRPLPLIGSLYHSLVVRPSLKSFHEALLCDTILITREGGFSRLSPEEVFMWARRYSLYALRTYLDSDRNKIKSAPAPAQYSWSEDMKRILLPVIEKEVKFILDQDWSRLKPEEHWRCIFRTWNSDHTGQGAESPDWIERRKSWSPEQKQKR